MTFAPGNSYGDFMPVDDYPPRDWDEYWRFISDRGRKSSDMINIREIARYEQLETQTGQLWYGADNQTKRYGWRKVMALGAIPAGGNQTTAHGITGTPLFTYIGGSVATAAPDSRPIPFASVTASNQCIEIIVGAVNIVVTNGAAAPAITSGFVVLEYIK